MQQQQLLLLLATRRHHPLWGPGGWGACRGALGEGRGEGMGISSVCTPMMQGGWKDLGAGKAHMHMNMHMHMHMNIRMQMHMHMHTPGSVDQAACVLTGAPGPGLHWRGAGACWCVWCMDPGWIRPWRGGSLGLYNAKAHEYPEIR